MQSDATISERRLTRLRQIAREESAAVRSGDIEKLCRLTEMLPDALEGLRQGGLPSVPQAEQILEEIRRAHEQAEKYLQEQMRAVRRLLQHCATARRTLRAYGKRSSPGQVDNRG
jgi:hypothetical protein